MIADSRKRPRTLLEVSRRAKGANGEAFDRATREFLDAFYADPAGRRAALEERPEALGAVQDAYLAAMAEHLARCFRLPVPDWSETHGNGLTRPFFAGGLEDLKAILTVESPTAFRRRLLFVSKDALSRPRLAQAGPSGTPLSGRRP
jgi:hypothetical protein